MNQAPPSDHKHRLRERLLTSRTAMPSTVRRRADRQICAHLLRLLEERDCVDLAAYVAHRGEPDLMPALHALADAGRRIWLPVVEGRRMHFRRWRPGVEMVANRYGIPEPAQGPQCPPERLELVLTPLVAWSKNGHRLGMGAGYYDRTFRFLLDDPDAGPWLVGVGYAMQQIDSLAADPWDVPLGAVLTERGLEVFRE